MESFRRCESVKRPLRGQLDVKFVYLVYQAPIEIIGMDFGACYVYMRVIGPSELASLVIKNTRTK